MRHSNESMRGTVIEQVYQASDRIIGDVDWHITRHVQHCHANVAVMEHDMVEMIISIMRDTHE